MITTKSDQTVLLALDPLHFPELKGARQTLIPGAKHPENPVLRPRPGHWDGTRCKVYGTVLYDPNDRLFKMWYSGTTDTSENIRRSEGSTRHVGYAFSHDGVHWERPNLGVINFEGSHDNNLVLLDAQAPSVFIQEHDKDPNYRFLMLTEAGLHTNRNKVLFSPDGVRWTAGAMPPMDSGEHGPKIHEPFSILFDPKETDESKRWKGYSLLHISRNGYRGRAIGLFVSADPAQWNEFETQPIMSAETGMESEIHLPHVTRFYDTYVMLYDAMEPNHHTQTEIAVSDDGLNFRRVQNGVKVVPNGDAGAHDGGKVCVSPRSLFTHEGKLWWYYTTSTDTYQSCPRNLLCTPWYRYTCLAQWRQDGFACMEADDAGDGQ